MASLSILLLITQSPLLMSIVVVTQTLIVSLFSLSIISDVWLVIMLLLIYFGGVMVLFIYICSLAQEEPVNTSKSYWVLLLPGTFIMDLSLIKMSADEFSMEAPFISSLYSNSGAAMGILLVAYLLLALVIVVKLTKFYKGALRKV